MLIQCPDCGRDVSDRAKVCPHCGYPIEETEKKAMLVEFDAETMEGKTPEDVAALEVAMDFYGDLLVSGDGRVWNSGGQVVGEMKYKGTGL